MNPDVGPRCPACRMGLVTHVPEDPQCIANPDHRAHYSDSGQEK